MATERQQPDGVRQFKGPGVEIDLLASGPETSDAVSVFEYSAEAGFQGPPPHWHAEMVEGFYILDGTLDFTVDGQDRQVGPGEYLLVPTHTIHTFELTDDEPARFLVHTSPGGFEAYFEKLGGLIAEEESWPPDDMAPVHELMGRYDTHAPPVVHSE